LNKPHATFTIGDDSPLNGGDAKGLGNGLPEMPPVKWGIALATNAPPKKYATARCQATRQHYFDEDATSIGSLVRKICAAW
jgi:hypothetical protein